MGRYILGALTELFKASFVELQNTRCIGQGKSTSSQINKQCAITIKGENGVLMNWGLLSNLVQPFSRSSWQYVSKDLKCACFLT